MKRVDAFEFTEFEWDDEKRDRTLKDREIDFRAAAQALFQPRLEESSDRYGEVRTLAICAGTKQILAVVYTARGQVCRIISVRPARRYERKEYREIFGG